MKEKKWNMTVPQEIVLGASRCLGYNFYPEYPVPYYEGKLKWLFADLCDIKRGIIIEVDGGYHTTAEQIERDKKKDSIYKSHGFKVFRITNKEACSEKIKDFFDNMRKELYNV